MKRTPTSFNGFVVSQTLMSAQAIRSDKTPLHEVPSRNLNFCESCAAFGTTILVPDVVDGTPFPDSRQVPAGTDMPTLCSIPAHP